MPTIHLIAPFHMRLTPEGSHCAFSQKSLRFSKMMHLLPDYKIIEYSVGGSTSEADERVGLLTEEEFNTFYPPQPAGAFHGDYARIGMPGWEVFNTRLIAELKKRVLPGEIIGHQFGRSHAALPTLFPNNPNVELGIGYPDKPFGCWRIFESNAWRHYHWGRDDQANPRDERGSNRLYSWVIPNYFDLSQWPIGAGERDYLLYFGRICSEKGMQIIVEIIRAMANGTDPVREFVFAGQGDFKELVSKQVFRDPAPNPDRVFMRFIGPVTGSRRAQILGNARCTLMPTQFVEPFGGAGVEGMLCGTPLIASDFGAFTETVEDGVTGFRCQTLADWVAAIGRVGQLERQVVSTVARQRYGLTTVARLYDAAFRQILDLADLGWYSPVSHRIPH